MFRARVPLREDGGGKSYSSCLTRSVEGKMFAEDSENGYAKTIFPVKPSCCTGCLLYDAVKWTMAPRPLNDGKCYARRTWACVFVLDGARHPNTGYVRLQRSRDDLAPVTMTTPTITFTPRRLRFGFITVNQSRAPVVFNRWVSPRASKTLPKTEAELELETY